MTHPSTVKTRRRFLFVLLLLAALLWQPAQLACKHSSSERDAWQRPTEVMDALDVKPGSVVGDVGCGSGYFTFHLAARVGAQGKVYAVDIKTDELAKIRSRAAKEGLAQIETILGAPDDPHLPAEALDTLLVVNAYHEMRDYDAMLQGFYRALKPGGLLGIIENVAKTGVPRSAYYERHVLPEELVREDVARNGFHFLRSEPGFMDQDEHKKQYFLIFDKPNR